MVLYKEDCFAYCPEVFGTFHSRCSALKTCKCEDCKFYKTVADYKERFGKIRRKEKRKKMEFTEKFKFLKADVIEKKDKSGIFLKVHAIDSNGNLYKFFVAKDEIIQKFGNQKLITLQDITINFTVTQNDDNWNVRMNDFNPVPAGK